MVTYDLATGKALLFYREPQFPKWTCGKRRKIWFQQITSGVGHERFHSPIDGSVNGTIILKILQIQRKNKQMIMERIDNFRRNQF